MGFFDPPPPFEPPEPVAQPAWIGPPDNVLGVGAPLRLLLGRSDRVAVAITGCTVYPTGLLLDVAIRLRPGSLSREERRLLMHGGPLRAFEVPDDGQVLRLGVLYADGRKATTQNERHPFGGADEPEGPVFMQRGGGGGENAWDMRIWLWPLPPAGTLTFVAEWPTLGIAETRVETDATPLVEAAGRAEGLWPEGGPAGGGFSTQYVYSRRTTGQTDG